MKVSFLARELKMMTIAMLDIAYEHNRRLCRITVRYCILKFDEPATNFNSRLLWSLVAGMAQPGTGTSLQEGTASANKFAFGGTGLLRSALRMGCANCCNKLY